MTTALSGPHSRGPLNARLVDLVSGTGAGSAVRSAWYHFHGSRSVSQPAAASGASIEQISLNTMPKLNWSNARVCHVHSAARGRRTRPSSPVLASPHVYDRGRRVSGAEAVLMRDDRKERLTVLLNEITEVSGPSEKTEAPGPRR